MSSLVDKVGDALGLSFGSGQPGSGSTKTTDAQSGQTSGTTTGGTNTPSAGTARSADLGATTSVYPQDLFQANQVNAVGFYIIAKKKLGSGESNRGISLTGDGTTSSGINAKAAADNYLADYFSGDAEGASEGNRASAENVTATDVGAMSVGALAVAGGVAETVKDVSYGTRHELPIPQKPSILDLMVVVLLIDTVHPGIST